MASAIDKIEVIGRIVFARWKAGPTSDDVKFMEDTMARHHQQLGQKLFYVAAVVPTAKVPSPDERANLQNVIKNSRSYCDHTYVVIEGSELQSNLIRVVISGALIVSRTYGDYLSVHKNGDQVVEDLKRNHNLEASQFVQQARQRGILS
jgi:hypothetical protein